MVERGEEAAVMFPTLFLLTFKRPVSKNVTSLITRADTQLGRGGRALELKVYVPQAEAHFPFKVALKGSLSGGALRGVSL